MGPATRRSVGAKHLAGPTLRLLAAAHFDQRADDRPHHVVEEAVGLDLDGDEIFLPPCPALTPGTALTPGPSPKVQRGEFGPPCPALFAPDPRSTDNSKIVRTLVLRSAPLLSKLLKSCVPSKAAAAGCMASASSRP